MARPSTPVTGIGGIAVELTAAELELCKSSVLTGCSVDSFISPSATTGPTQKEPALAVSTFTAAKMSTLSVNTLLGTLGLTPSASFGYGVTVALIDSGIYPSSAFTGRIKAFYDFTAGSTIAKAPFDDYGHGTHVAGLIGGLQGLADIEYEGVAPAVQFVGLKVLDGNGGGRTSD
jgi:subtilisin family serine protease